VGEREEENAQTTVTQYQRSSDQGESPASESKDKAQNHLKTMRNITKGNQKMPKISGV